MKKTHLFLFIVAIFVAGCAARAPKPSPPVQPPAEREGTALNINLSDLEDRIRALEKMQKSKSLSERDAKRVSTLLESYRLLKRMASGPVTGKACDTLTQSLYQSLSLMEKGYFESIAKAPGDENDFADYIRRKNEIVNLYLKKDYKGVIQRTLALQTRFPGGLPPRIGILFALSLAQDGMLQEAVEIGSEVAREIEGSPDAVKLRGEMARWQLALGQPAQAAETLEKISRIQDERSRMINDLSQQIQKVPKEPDQPFRSVFRPPEGAEPREVPPPMGSLQEEVDTLVRNHEFAEARQLLLKEKGQREEGPETAFIDRALKNIEEAESTYDENVKIKAAYQKETYETAERLYEKEDFTGVIKTLETLEKTQGLDAKAAELRDRAMESHINRERNRAAEIFLEAKKTKDPNRKKELLETSYNILKTLVEDYPRSPLKQKLTSHMKIVQREIEKLPGSGSER